jgi:hypothetical protein
MKKRKVFGVSSILVTILAEIFAYSFDFIDKIGNGQGILHLVIWFVITFLIVGLLFYNLIILDDNSLMLRYFSPFQNNVTIRLEQVDHIKIWVTGVKLSLVKVTVVLKNGKQYKLTSLSSHSFYNELNDDLIQKGILVERSGLV